MSLDDFDRLVESQGGKCAICGMVPTCGRVAGKLHVDHDHSSGKTRGLICMKCNTALGGFGDNLEGVMKVVEYLRRSLD
jgi:hypothetical protein